MAGYEQFSRGRMAEALMYLEPILEEDLRSPQVLTMVAIAHHRLGDEPLARMYADGARADFGQGACPR